MVQYWMRNVCVSEFWVCLGWWGRTVCHSKQCSKVEISPDQWAECVIVGYQILMVFYLPLTCHKSPGMLSKEALGVLLTACLAYIDQPEYGIPDFHNQCVKKRIYLAKLISAGKKGGPGALEVAQVMQPLETAENEDWDVED
ncbi:hypothetical protein DFH08DRAFT_800487 [Mycena albidolilacea]|uniref:Uncharacterized protein n=1 Tax=Mycena albidolilacea TaxID=1033008 RepID=A0AAD7AKK9_9AGAR|nr:hypothetical protein DFH08DRAFT_800487 [Mycena albidolilacea]